jgi:glycine/sarcosine N-methyltransferase
MPPNIAEYYDCVINWEKRLAREMPLLEELARGAGRRVLVPACGTGGHVVALAARGFAVLGFDADADALSVARARIESQMQSIDAAAGEARVEQLTMEEAGQLEPNHDAAYCLGNALPGLSAPGQLRAAFKGMAAALRPGGIFFTQNLNYDLRWQQKTRWFPVLSGETKDEEVLLVKFADYETDLINFHAMFLTRPKSGGKWESVVKTSQQIPLFQARLAKALTQAGFSKVQFWGDYRKSAFDPEKSSDLIILAEKA